MPEEIEHTFHIAIDSDLTPEQETACHALLELQVSKAIEEYTKDIEELAQPHLEIADIMSSVASVQLRLLDIRSIFSEAMADNDAAADQLLRVQDLLKSLESIGIALNRAYYSSCKLLVDLSENDDLYKTTVEVAERLSNKEQVVATTDESS